MIRARIIRDDYVFVIHPGAFASKKDASVQKKGVFAQISGVSLQIFHAAGTPMPWKRRFVGRILRKIGGADGRPGVFGRKSGVFGRKLDVFGRFPDG